MQQQNLTVKKGEKVVAMNHAAIDRGVTDAVKS